MRGKIASKCTCRIKINSFNNVTGKKPKITDENKIHITLKLWDAEIKITEMKPYR